MESERRGSPCYPFFASVELTELTSGARLKASTSDLGSNGCYLDTINPLPRGTIISIQITYQGQVFAAGGVVAHSHPNMGRVRHLSQREGREILCCPFNHARTSGPML
jgi:hypothetical protein